MDGEWRLDVAALARTAAQRRAERAGELLARAAAAAVASPRAWRYVDRTFGVFQQHSAFFVPRTLALPRRTLAFTDALLLRAVCDALGVTDSAYDTLDGAELVQRAAGGGASLVLNFNTPLAAVVACDLLQRLLAGPTSPCRHGARTAKFHVPAVVHRPRAVRGPGRSLQWHDQAQLPHPSIMAANRRSARCCLQLQPARDLHFLHRCAA